jgi:hypothetical protein
MSDTTVQTPEVRRSPVSNNKTIPRPKGRESSSFTRGSLKWSVNRAARAGRYWLKDYGRRSPGYRDHV